MRIALCHLELSLGPEERNIEILERALEIAGENGVDWVITPETALQGYYFYRVDPERTVAAMPSPQIAGIRRQVKKYGMHLFLGCGEYDENDRCSYNACLVFGPDGSIIGRHRKIFGEKFVTEEWAERGTTIEPIQCGQLKAGVLVCADAWKIEHSHILKEKGAKLIIDIAAWPISKVCGNPLGYWLQCSEETGLPFLLCNQTGMTEYMNMNIGQSVAITNGELVLAYNGDPAVLICDYDEKQKVFTSERFMVKLM